MNRPLLLFAFAVVGIGVSLMTLALQSRSRPTPVVPEKPGRIVALTLASAEILVELVSHDRIAAVHEIAASSTHSNIRDRIGGLRRVPSDAEQVIALNPDLVMIASYSTAEFVEHLDKAGLPTHRFGGFNDVDAILGNIETMGRLVGEPDRAAALVTRTRARIEEVRRRIPKDGEPPRVMLLFETLTTAGRGTIFDSLAKLAGAHNVAADFGEGFKDVSVEHVLEWDPDFLIVAKDPETGASFKQMIESDPAFAGLRSKRIVEIPNHHFDTVSHHIVEGLEDLVQGIHP